MAIRWCRVTTFVRHLSRSRVVAYAKQCPPPRSHRQLDAGESLMDDVNRMGIRIISSVYFIYSNREICASHVRIALLHLMKTHPLLRMRVSSCNGKKYWTEITQPEPDLRVTSRADWKTLVSENSVERFDHERGPLWRVTFMPRVVPLLVDASRPYSSAFVVSFTHMTVDGVGKPQAMYTMLVILSSFFFSSMSPNVWYGCR